MLGFWLQVLGLPCEFYLAPPADPRRSRRRGRGGSIILRVVAVADGGADGVATREQRGHQMGAEAPAGAWPSMDRKVISYICMPCELCKFRYASVHTMLGQSPMRKVWRHVVASLKIA